MQEQAFRDYLLTRETLPTEIESQVAFIQRLESRLQEDIPSWTLEDLNHASIQSVVDDLIDSGENELGNLKALARYARVINHQEMHTAIIQMLDGYEAMERLHAKVGSYAGEDLRDMIFEGMPLPPLGLSSREKALYTYRIINRLETIFEEATCREIIKDSLRYLPETYFSTAKNDFYVHCDGDIDRYLVFRGEKFIETLRGYQSRDELFFGQEIDDEVIAFVAGDPQIGQGVHVNGVVLEKKIPYNTKAYLAEKDPRKKRYHYCHCPWAKESLRKGTFVVSATFCQCSAGFHKKPYEIIFGRPIKADVLKSVLNGDLFCQFAIHLTGE